MTQGCAAPAQTTRLPATVDLSNEAVIQGTVTRNGTPVPGAYARLLDSTGEFTAEVVTGDEGVFRFFAADGDWTVRVLAAGGVSVDTQVTAKVGEVAQVEVAI
ncbi:MULTISPECIES: DUF1416 domain-containing protein [Thermomonospora]|uniref:DUF1416 domain-containing protein n=1 Tax=Thermomonospora curvata (strain ATCC 19995 / DSM 43183 / JCM 3096 / KCTC 9072 / NBRC 15933 / NCIMB 10081 / Henssen B9) TaxID=471852 RepID=D1A4G3_THECD|nr:MULTISPECIES: DUF1416 domain-containing protein [Thermomonospora]ACY96198.1 hypothetical protein Tcur_0603 [Thermomonospora curvata DSM 43183]PKK15628.1 MAG: DUF1416 domain-containing protein [Thermomonospora sp. CIF 1]